MPGFVAAANVVQVKFFWSQHGILALNVIDCRVSAGFTVNASIANTVNTAVTAAVISSGLQGHLATTTAYNATGLLDRRTEGNASINSTNAGVAGTAVGLALPGQDAVCITKRTARAGKFYRGRVYLLGFAADALEADGLIPTAIGTACVTFMQTAASALVTNGLQPAIHSPHYPERPSSVPGSDPLPEHPESLTDVIAWELRDRVWDTQRRRLR